jgi:hypothetical protein
MATVTVMIGKGAATGTSSAAPVWQKFPRVALAATTTASSARIGTITAQRGDCVRITTTGAVWMSDDGTDAAANNGLYLPANETFEVQYVDGNATGWRVIDA